MPPRADHPWLHRYALLTALATLALIGVGGLVTSHGVGMAVPDWPNTYGYNMFLFPVSKWIGGIFYEHSHRLVASVVGMMTGVLALWLFGKKSRPFMRWLGLALFWLGIASGIKYPLRWAEGIESAIVGLALFWGSWHWPQREPAPRLLRRLGVLAFFAVVVQGVLGGLRVVLFKDQIGIFHATLAQLFFVLVSAIALLVSPGWAAAKSKLSSVPAAGGLRWLFLAASALILCQLMLGATMRHQHAGLAVPDFPLAYGKIWPATDEASVVSYNAHRLEVAAANPITAAQILLHMAHRISAVVILFAVAFATWRANRAGERLLAKYSRLWLTLIFAQATLGAATVWSNKAADVATLHVVMGALSLCLGSLLSIWAFQVESLPRAVPEARKSAPAGLDSSAPATGIA